MNAPNRATAGAPSAFSAAFSSKRIRYVWLLLCRELSVVDTDAERKAKISHDILTKTKEVMFVWSPEPQDQHMKHHKPARIIHPLWVQDQLSAGSRSEDLSQDTLVTKEQVK